MNTGHSSFAIDFGQDGNSHLFRKEGWSEPEPRYTWTTGLASSLELPRPDEPGEYLLELNVHPFISDGKIPSQKLRVMINDAEVGDFDVRISSSLECLLPWDLLKADRSVSLRFTHPFAASRRAITGEPDERLIALAFQRISLRKLQDVDDETVESPPPNGAALRELPRPTAPTVVEAHVDAYGYYLTTRSWVFVGWTSQAWTADQNAGITARFDGRDERGSVVSGFYDRPGLQGRGQGFVLAMPARPRRRQVAQSRLLGLQIGAADVSLTVDGHGYVPVEADELDRVLRPILADAPENENLAALLPHLPAGLVAEAPATRFDGYIDLYSYDLSLSGWFLLGWLRRPWREDIRPATVARFEGREAAGELRSAFYDRPDVRDRGFGCLLFLADTIAEGEQLPELLSLEVDTGSSRRRLQGPAREAATSSELLAEIGPLLGNAAPGSALAAFRSLLGLHAAPVVLPLSFEGYIDFCGYHAGAGGWLFCGWVTSPWADTDTPTAIAQFADGDVSGQALATFYRREEIADRGIGVVFLVPFRQRRAQTAALGRDRVPRVHGDASSERS